MPTETARVALVTGAGSGMGRCTAEAFLVRGWTVLAFDLTPGDLDEGGGRLISVATDVTDREAVERAVADHLPALGGEIHAVANVAGIYPPSTLDTVTTEQYRRVFDVNVLGVINVMAVAAPHMPAGSGIVNFASIDGYTVSPGQLVYGASKAAVIMLTKSVALELAPRGIRFNTTVESVVPIPTNGPVGAAGWTVTLHTGEVIDYDGVLVANGHLWDQKIPDVGKDFTGMQVHSGSYRNPGDIEGDRVLVVGAGNSGCDLAVDVAQHRIDVDIVIREGIFFQPKSYFGVPRQAMPWLADFSADEQDFIARMLAKISIGTWSDYPGMPEPKARTLAEGRATVNDLLLFWVLHGRIKIRPGIDRIEGKLVHFTDGTSTEYDTILWATGFNASLPFLDESLIARRDGVPLRVAGGIVPKGLEKLYYIGLAAPRGPQIPVYGVQTKYAIRMIALHEQAADGFAGVGTYLSGLQEDDARIDIVRVVWEEQLADTARLLDAFALARESEHSRAPA